MYLGISSDSKNNIQAMIRNLKNSSDTFSTLLAGSQKDILETLSTFRKTAQTMDEISTELKKHPVKFLFKK